MQEVLSQSEIDSLLEAMTSGSVNVDKIKQKQPGTKLYDFRRPNKFTKEHLRTLDMVSQQYARLLSSFLSGYLRTNITIEVGSVGQMIYEEFTLSIPSPTVLSIFAMDPLEGSVILETSPQFIFPVIDLLFGGPGTASEKLRELTDIELIVAKKINAKILESMPQAWNEVLAFTPRIQSMETNPRLQQLYSPNEVVALITFIAHINDEVEGMLNLCLPYIVLDPVISRLSVRQQYIRKAGTAKKEDLSLLKHWLGQSEIDLEVVLGVSELTVREMLEIQKGNVLVLNKQMDQDMEMYVNGLLKFGVQAGSLGNHRAVQVISLIEGDQDNE
ncbi:MAG: flagellar motor switch protein FliM [Bacillota bacterium]